MLYVADDRKQESLDAFWLGLPRELLNAIDAIAMDMCAPYIQSTMLNVPAADTKIVFDKFHIAQMLGRAVDDVRRMEVRRLRGSGDDTLTGTRFMWLKHPGTMSRAESREFAALRCRAQRRVRAGRRRDRARVLPHVARPGARAADAAVMAAEWIGSSTRTP